MKIHDKLVRDRIPEIIRDSGKIPLCETLSDEQYLDALEQKLLEEAQEYRQIPCMEEMADLLEVIEAICRARGFETETLQNIKKEKARKRGAFEKRIFLHAVAEKDEKIRE